MTTRYDLEILIRTKQEGNGVPEVERQIKRLQNTMKNLVVGGLFVAGTQQVAEFAKASIDAASDAQEAASKFQYVFGPAADDVGNRLDTFAESANRSSLQLRSMAADVGAMTEAMLGSKEAAGAMSVDIAQLAVDLASFHNVTEDEALTALKAGLIGESEPMRRFGVLLSETAVQERIFADGLAKTKSGITDAMKAQARFNIIMEQTATAQGDAERTGDSYANQVRGLEAAMLDLQVTIGTALLPTVTEGVTELAKLTNTIANDLTPSLQALSGEYNTAVEEMIEENLAAANSMEPLIAEAEKLSNVLGRTGFAAGATGTFDAIREGIIGTGRAMAVQADSLEEYEQGLAGFSGLAATTFDTHLGTLRLTVEEYYNLVRAGEAVESSDRAMLIAAQNVSQQARDVGDSLAYGSDLADRYGAAAQEAAEDSRKFGIALRAQEEAAIAANAALVGAFRDTAGPIEDLLAAQADLEAAQGEWVTAVRSSSGQVADINSQLAADLSSEQKQAYEDILDTVAEGSAEWLAAYQALQSDLTDSQRAELVAQRAELEAAGEQIVNVYTGDAAAAEDAQGRIEAANAALIESYRNLALEGSLALAELSPDPEALQRALDYAVAIGAMTPEAAELRLQAAETRLAIEDLNTMVVQSGLDAGVAGEAFRLLTEGEARTAEEAVAAAEDLLKLNEQLDRIPGSYEAEIAANAGSAIENLELVEARLNSINGRTVRAYVEIEERIQSSQQDQSVVGSGGNGGGGRAGGGPVSAGRTYRVGEGNRPELLSTDNGLFMIPGDNGRVFSNQESQSLFGGIAAGQTSLSITVHVETVGDPDRVGNLVARGVMDAARQLGLAT